MRDKAFLDTNILVYLHSQRDAVKGEVARRIFEEYSCVVSFQTLNEAVNVWIKKTKLSEIEIYEFLENIQLNCTDIRVVTRNTINLAISLKFKHNYSYFDCLMLASALEAGCSVIMTEDMAHGQIIEGELKIINPFAE